MAFNPRDFLDPVCGARTIDIFNDRRGILRALQEAMPLFHGTLLDIGCGYMPYKPLILSPPSRITQYIGLDFKHSEYQPPDLEWDGRTIPLEAQSVDCAIATELFEHCPEPESLMREALRVLKPGGLLFFTVPFLWPLHDVPHDEYRFTPFALRRHLGNAGFEDIKLQAQGGWDASLAQMIGLWVRRRPMGRRMRQLLSQIAVPIVKALLKRDRPPIRFERNTMMTGLSGTARKAI